MTSTVRRHQRSPLFLVVNLIFSDQYLCNRSTLAIGVLGYIGIVWPKEHSPEVWSVPPVTPCIYTKLCRPTVQSQCSGFLPFVTGSDELYTHILLFTCLLHTQQFILYVYTLFIYQLSYFFRLCYVISVYVRLLIIYFLVNWLIHWLFMRLFIHLCTYLLMKLFINLFMQLSIPASIYFTIHSCTYILIHLVLK